VFSSFIILVQTQETRIILAIKAIRMSKRKLSYRKATGIYNIPEPIFHTRLISWSIYSNTQPNCLKLTKLEEEKIIRYIFDRDSRGFLPRLVNIKNIINYFLEVYKTKYIRKY
jgi:hypothetical protein